MKFRTLIDELNYSSMVLMSAALGVLGTSAAHAKDRLEERPTYAYAYIQGCKDPDIVGRAILVEAPSEEGIKSVRVNIKVKGLTPGKHAVHIHETASCEPCGSAGGHFDPGKFGETNPDANHPYHSGDLINIESREKRGYKLGYLRAVTTRVTLSRGPLSLFDKDGSAFIIHDLEDTYCPRGEEAGCAGGSRAACGVIEPAGR